MLIWRTQVRWAECDVAGIIYHAHVFDWFSESRIQWLMAHDLDYYKILRPRGIELLVRHAEAQFFYAMHPGDLVAVDVELTGLSPTRARFTYRVLRDDITQQETSRGMTEHIFVQQGHASRVDRHNPDLFARFQAAYSQSQ
ncbi:thioesterase [Sulfobacillus thermosulfidooxidans]|nr:thioesterase [Sulfobacillus thermosulfidooxidans]OLZ14506.1 thioesterase [Sulfobacillus thermosulfidooxidans]OLZ19232.1 thioesterase [Sulfobacillus thermosulfidooxidans]